MEPKIQGDAVIKTVCFLRPETQMAIRNSNWLKLLAAEHARSAYCEK